MMSPPTRVRRWGRLPSTVAAAAVVAAVLGACGQPRPEDGGAVMQGGAHAALDYAAPPLDSAPAGPMGDAIRRGHALLVRTTDSLPDYAGANLQCASCHLDAGRRRNAAALLGVYARYPKHMARTGRLVSIEERVNHCFVRSMAGRPLPRESDAMQHIVAYLAFLSTGVPHGASVVGEGMPTMPPLTGDSARGAALFAATCTSCHGADGGGQPGVIPALFGPGAYSIGASMAREERAASFIRHFMPQHAPGSLTDQQAFDLAAYINAQPRPDTPGKGDDWPRGGAPGDVPYATRGRQAYRPPSTLLGGRLERGRP